MTYLSDGLQAVQEPDDRDLEWEELLEWDAELDEMAAACAEGSDEG